LIQAIIKQNLSYSSLPWRERGRGIKVRPHPHLTSPFSGKGMKRVMSSFYREELNNDKCLPSKGKGMEWMIIFF
jgi:hypothetical protein